MAKFFNLSIDVAADLFVFDGSWETVREISAKNAALIASERRRYVTIAKEGK
jgi:hypothetical protein